MTEPRQHTLFDEIDDIGTTTSFAYALFYLHGIEGLGVKNLRKITQVYGAHLGQLVEGQGLERLTEAQVGPSIKDLVIETVRHRKAALEKQAERQIDDLKRSNIHLIGGHDLPPQLKGAADSPGWLFVQGDPGVLFAQAPIAVVGTREATDQGRRHARLVGEILAGHKVTLVSGLAEGIDDEIHRCTLDAGLKNIAFLGHGIYKIFPASTSATRTSILNRGGAVATEYFPNDSYQRSFFVQRNRLQAMLSKLVIFVEAKEQSGTAHTFRFAQAYERRIVGVQMSQPGLDKIIEEAGYPVLNLNTPQGTAALEQFTRQVIGNTKFGNRVIERMIKRVSREIRLRGLSEGEVNLFLTEVMASAYKAAEEVKSDRQKGQQLLSLAKDQKESNDD